MTNDQVASIDLHPEQLIRLHRAQLDIALAVKAVCDRHDIKYFLMAGTLLGAVRHRGFIPWDDDMDIGMPRDSYDKFLRVAPAELGRAFFVQCTDTDPGYGLAFTKIRLNGTILLEASSAKTSARNGIFIDIFPFDNVPDKAWKQSAHDFATSTLKRLLLLRQGYEPWSTANNSKIKIYQTLAVFAKTLPRQILIALLDKSMRWFNSDITRMLTAIGGSYGYRKESVERNWMDEFVDIEFEGIKLKRLKGSNNYLTSLYGEFMVLPKPEQRVSRHGIISLDFGSTSTA